MPLQVSRRRGGLAVAHRVRRAMGASVSGGTPHFAVKGGRGWVGR